MLEVGVIGAGWMGRQHAEILASRDDVRVTAVADADASTAAALADDVGAAAHVDHGPVVAAADAVYVATPPRSRVGIVEDAAAAGTAVFGEKPLAATPEEGRAIVDAVDAAGIPFMTGFCNRFREPLRELRDLIDDGAVGEPLQLFSVRHGQGIPEGENWRTDPEQSVGMTVESVSHDLDLLRWLGGEVASAAGEVAGSLPDLDGFDDTLSAAVRFESGAVGSLQAGWTATVGHCRRGVVGTGGTAVVEGRDQWQLDRLRWRGTDENAEQVRAFDGAVAADMGYRAETDAFVEALRAGEPMPVDERDGLRALDLSHEILAGSGDVHAWV